MLVLLTLFFVLLVNGEEDSSSLLDETHCYKNDCYKGRCVEDQRPKRGYFCVCNKGYGGRNCDKKVCYYEDSCKHNSCNFGRCLCDPSVSRGYSCVCMDGYMGEDCDSPIPSFPDNPCDENDCVNGSCIVDDSESRGYHCSCEDGFIGDNCDEPQIPEVTTPEPCSGSGDNCSESVVLSTGKDSSSNCDCEGGKKGFVLQYSGADTVCEVDTGKLTQSFLVNSGSTFTVEVESYAEIDCNSRDCEIDVCREPFFIDSRLFHFQLKVIDTFCTFDTEEQTDSKLESTEN